LSDNDTSTKANEDALIKKWNMILIMQILPDYWKSSLHMTV